MTTRNDPTYTSWRCMIQRVTNPRHPRYAGYGGRGIVITPEWRASYLTFLRDVGPRPAGHTLDRIDVDGHYEPGNVRWATALEQRHNQRPKAQEGR